MKAQHDNDTGLLVSATAVSPASRALLVIMSSDIPPSERLSTEAYEEKIKEMIGMDIPVEVTGFGSLRLD